MSDVKVGDVVQVDFEDVGMSHRQRYVGPAEVISIAPTLQVKPSNWAHPRMIRRQEITDPPYLPPADNHSNCVPCEKYAAVLADNQRLLAATVNVQAKIDDAFDAGRRAGFAAAASAPGVRRKTRAAFLDLATSPDRTGS